MMEYLFKQTANYINSLYEDVECYQQEEMYRRVWQGNNSILYIVHHIKGNHLEKLQIFYEFSINYQQFKPLNFLENIVSLIRLDFQKDLCKKLLTKLLQLQKNQFQLIKKLPPDLYKQIFMNNSIAYEKEVSKVQSRTQQNRIWKISDSKRGYSQIILMMTTFLQSGIVKRSHHETWGGILQIVGRYNLDFHKVVDIMLSKMVDKLESCSVNEHLAILRNIDIQSFLQLISKNFYRINQQWPKDLVVSQQIPNLVNKTSLELFNKNIHYYNPKYVQLIQILITNQTFRIQEVLSNFYSLTEQQIYEFQAEKLNLVNQKISEIFLMDEKAQIKSRFIMGQALYCFKLTLMTQFIKGNQFAYFKQLYSSLCSKGRFDIIIHAPLIREICLLLEWMINPFYQKNFYPSKFKKNYSQKQLIKQGGYFKQYSQVNIGLFQDLQQIFSYLQINIGFYPKALVKLIRILKFTIKGNPLKIQWGKLFEYKIIIQNLTKLYLLPASTLPQHNPAISLEINGLLQQFTQSLRLEIYGYYQEQIMFLNPYLLNVFRQATMNQFRILHNINTKNKSVLNAQLNQISKIQHNQFFQSSFYLLKRGLSTLLNQIQILASAIGRSTHLSGDVMMFLALSHLIKNIDKNELQRLGKLVYYLLLKCPTLDLSFFIQMILKKMRQGEEQQFRNSMTIFQFIINQIYPNKFEFVPPKMKLDFQGYGYHLKLYINDKMKDFNQSKSIRSRLHSALGSIIITSDNTQHSYLYEFIRVLTNRINLLSSSGTDIERTATQIDKCMECLNNLTNFHAYQTNRLRELNHSRLLVPNYICITDNQFIDLIRDENTKVSIAIVCRLFRAFKKAQLLSPKSYYQQIPLKKFWQKIYKDFCYSSPIYGLRESVPDPSKLNSFIHSDFYFFFWTCQLQNVCQLDQVYKIKIEQLRRLISKKQDIFQVSTDCLDNQNRQRYKIIYEMLQKQQSELAYYYQKFNVTLSAINVNKLPHERVSKLTIPSLFSKQKDDGCFNDFGTLLFLQCLLPRMIVDEGEAYFCSRMVFKIIKQNKLPANKALTMIFNLIQAAISYIPNSTKRQSRCISIFTSDLLRIFIDWDKMDELSIRLQNQINMEKFNQKRYEKLKDYLNHFQTRIIDILTSNHQEYIIGNCLQFMESNDYLPISVGQTYRMLKYLQTMKLVDNQMLALNVKRLSTILQYRKKKLGSFVTINDEKQLKKFVQMSKTSQASNTKPKIYKEQQAKKPKAKQTIEIY